MGSGFKTFTAGSVLTASDVQNYLQDQAVMVFGGTAARSSAIGTANFEEGMLTYLTDVDKLQVYTGSSFQDVYPPAATSQGMTLINTTSFSAVASQSINDVFSATYDNYRIVINQNASVDTSFYFRLRVAGADNTASNYAWVKFLYRSGIQIDSGNGSDTFWNLATNSVVRRGLITIDIGQPFATQNTVFNTQFSWSDASFQVSGIAGGNTSVTTSYTGFTIFPASGTITGEVSVYGYNK